MINRELNVLIDALGAAGVISSVFGLPNLFSGLRGRTALPATSNFSTGGSDPLGVMPYFNPEIPGVDDEEAGRYVAIESVRPPGVPMPSVLPSQVRRITRLGLTTVVNNLFGFGFFGQAGRLNSIATFRPRVSIGPDIRLSQQDELAKLRKPERSMRQRYESPNDPTTVLSSDARDGVEQTKTRLDNQRDDLKKLHPDYVSAFSRYGVVGGINLRNIDRFADATTDEEHQEIRSALDPNEDGRGRYYHDTLNIITEIEGSDRPDDIAGVTLPVDYIKVHFVDEVNNRLIPFRAMLTSLAETVATQYNDQRYIGRIERNIVYLGANRGITFGLYVHSWASAELKTNWRKLNSLTGLTFPSRYSADGFMVPPLVKLTIGNLYVDQPGYISNLTNTVEEGTSWEIDEDSQVPFTIKVDVQFELIEKDAMEATSDFYGFGLPRTAG
jgi:hypothetical protein